MSRSFGGKSLVSLVYHTRFSTLAFPATRLAQMQPKNSGTALRCRVCARHEIYRMREVPCVEAFAESFPSSCAREQQQQKQQPAFCRCLRTAVWRAECPRRVSAVASCLARFVFRGVRQQQQHVLASLLARSRARVFQPTPRPASTSVWQGRLSVGAVSEGSELSNSLAIAAYQKCQSAIIGLLSLSLSPSLPPSLGRSPWTLLLSLLLWPNPFCMSFTVITA